MTGLTPSEWEALALSARVGLTATLLSLPPGVALGVLLARKRFPGRALVETVLALPLVLPPVVTGYVLLVLFGRHGWPGSWLESMGWGVAFTWKGAAIASAVVGFPLLVRTIQVAVAAIDPGLEAAARTLGAGRWRTAFTVTLPLARGGIIAGALLAFARSVGEFGATITFVGNLPGETRTLPLEIYTQLQTPDGEAAAARLVALSIALSLAALLAGEFLRRRGGGEAG